jgi:hypothetical protein
VNLVLTLTDGSRWVMWNVWRSRVERDVQRGKMISARRWPGQGEDREFQIERVSGRQVVSVEAYDR